MTSGAGRARYDYRDTMVWRIGPCHPAYTRAMASHAVIRNRRVCVMMDAAGRVDAWVMTN